jgi:iron complex outermembrane receptor protein
VSRPVIRGLDGDRIRVLQNGTGTLDASSLSFDHAVPYDPLAAERIEEQRREQIEMDRIGSRLRLRA